MFYFYGWRLMFFQCFLSNSKFGNGFHGVFVMFYVCLLDWFFAFTLEWFQVYKSCSRLIHFQCLNFHRFVAWIL